MNLYKNLLFLEGYLTRPEYADDVPAAEPGKTRDVSKPAPQHAVAQRREVTADCNC